MLYLNGQKLTPELAFTYFHNRTFKYGDGLFESVRIYKGLPLFWKEHQARLRRGMDLLGMEYIEDSFFQNIHRNIFQAIDDQKITNGRLRLHAFRRGAGTYLPVTNAVDVVMEIAALKTDFFSEPQITRLTDYREISLVKNKLSGLKTANALTYVLAAQHAQKKGWDDAVLFCGDQISETSSANIFFFSQKKLYTPSLKSGCLDGVMRKKILEVAQSLKLDVWEKS
ncbi:MAG: aminotransferase class IV, partial [Bacteroidota bacterium]